MSGGIFVNLAGAEGLEPSDDGTKTRCLTNLATPLHSHGSQVHLPGKGVKFSCCFFCNFLFFKQTEEACTGTCQLSDLCAFFLQLFAKSKNFRIGRENNLLEIVSLLHTVGEG